MENGTLAMSTPSRCRIWFTYTQWYPQPAGAQAAADQHLVNARHTQKVAIETATRR